MFPVAGVETTVESEHRDGGSLENKGNASVVQSPEHRMRRGGRNDENKSKEEVTFLRIHIARQLSKASRIAVKQIARA